MCLLCIDIQKNKLTPKEIAKNYVEMTFDDDHYQDVIIELSKVNLDKEVAKEINKIYTERSNGV